MNAKWSASMRHGSLEVVGEDGKAICELWQRGNAEQEMRHARLIAAAPMLLKELQMLRACLKPWIESGHRVPGIATLNGADAAIAAATGKTK